MEKDDPLPVGVQAYELMVLPAQAVALAETVRGPLIQVIGPLLVTLTLGLQVSTVRVVEPVAVQPFPDCVMVTE